MRSFHERTRHPDRELQAHTEGTASQLSIAKRLLVLQVLGLIVRFLRMGPPMTLKVTVKLKLFCSRSDIWVRPMRI